MKTVCKTVALSASTSKQRIPLSEILTLQSGDLPLDWSAGQGVFQGINMDFIVSCHLWKTRQKKKTSYEDLKSLAVLLSLQETEFNYTGCCSNHNCSCMFMLVDQHCP